ncbi:hypothetical protein [Peribacillus deserti]|nr:hypothetical protein [Peribacillus deserti]
MSDDFKTPLNGFSMQEGFEKKRKEQQMKITKLENELKQLAEKIKKNQV